MAITYNVSDRLPPIHILLHDPVLEDTNRRQYIERVFVTGLHPVKHETDDDFLPRWTSAIPEFGLFQIDNVSHILHDSMQCSSGQYFVLVVICDRDE